MNFIDLNDIGYFIYMQEQEQKQNYSDDDEEHKEYLKSEQATQYRNKK